MGVFAFSLIILYSLFTLCLYVENPYVKASHEINIVGSMAKLDTISVPKILIIGGSGCGFGIDSKVISEYFNKPVVNTGTHAGLGLRLQLRFFDKYISKDDLVLVIPEYDNFCKGSFWGSDTALRIMSSIYPEGYGECSFLQMLYLLTFSPKHFFNAVSCRNQGSIPDINSPYSMNALNQFGDVTNYEERKHLEIGVYDTLKGYNPFVRSYLAKYYHKVLSSGANMFLVPPSLSASSFDNSREFIERLYKRYDKGELQFIASPDRYALPDSLYYDTPYHMTYDGVELRTELLIEDIELAINEVIHYNN